MPSPISSYFGFGKAAEQKPAQDPGAIRALPSSWYTSQEMYELERRAIFSRKWLFMTHKLRFQKPGDFLRYNVAGYDVVISMDRSNNIHAFHNVCRHRAYTVVEQTEGNAKIFSCRYHGWSYGLDGKLAKAPGYQDLPGFDKEQNSLLPIHVHVDSKGFVWINLDSKKVPEIAWADDFEAVDTQARFDRFDFSEYDFDHSWAMEGDYNWKILSDNFNECYHCKTTHPDVPSFINIESYDIHTKDGHMQHASACSAEQENSGMFVNSTYYFPNVSMTVSKHFMMIQKFMPGGPTKSTMHYEVFRNRYSKEEDFQHINQMYKRVMKEDKALCDKAQQNLNAGVFINGELHPKMEKGPLYFQKVVRETVVEHHKREKQIGQEIWPARQALPATAGVSQEDVDFCNGLSCAGRDEGLVW